MEHSSLSRSLPRTDQSDRPMPGRRIRVCYFNAWADGLEPAEDYLAQLPTLDLTGFVTNRHDAALMQKARLDCDWYGENLRCFAQMEEGGLELLPAQVCGLRGVLDLLKENGQTSEERWLITTGHQPQHLEKMAGKVFELLRRSGVRILYYAFDEASRFMPCFREIAPHIDVLIHDESPLDQVGAAGLRSDCRHVHRSWVANFVPFKVPFNESPEQKILFLGSQLGLTEHRHRQIEFLRRRFKDRFVASYDHSISVADRHGLNRYKVGLCPEGRKFTTPAMNRSHTDRPFWSGCLGLVPVSENSKDNNRLNDLAAAELIVRYPHGHLNALADACEKALEMRYSERRRIYDHFNRNETIGVVVAEQIAKLAPATAGSRTPFTRNPVTLP